MSKIVRRGFIEEDEKEFGEAELERLKTAAVDIKYLLNRGYSIKNAVTFVGNHFMLSQRQRLLLTRSLSAEKELMQRKQKELSQSELSGQTVNIDGFNTIITLETALSHSMLLKGQDGTIRDLAGLRGNYRVIDKTPQTVHLLLQSLKELGVKEAAIYLDSPVSNSGKLGALILEIAQEVQFAVRTELKNNVDQILETLKYVITSDAIILNRCDSWFNMNQYVLQHHGIDLWLVDVNS